MSDPFADGGDELTAAEGGNVAAGPPPSASGKSSGPRRKVAIRKSLDADDFINLLHGSDPVKVELNRLENEVRGRNVARSEFISSHFGRIYFIFWKKVVDLKKKKWRILMLRFFFLPPDKDRELGEAQAEIKALRLSERAREKACEEVNFVKNFFFFFFFPG